jgi:hypothetical protein
VHFRANVNDRCTLCNFLNLNNIDREMFSIDYTPFLSVSNYWKPSQETHANSGAAVHAGNY